MYCQLIPKTAHLLTLAAHTVATMMHGVGSTHPAPPTSIKAINYPSNYHHQGAHKCDNSTRSTPPVFRMVFGRNCQIREESWVALCICCDNDDCAMICAPPPHQMRVSSNARAWSNQGWRLYQLSCADLLKVLDARRSAQSGERDNGFVRAFRFFFQISNFKGRYQP